MPIPNEINSGSVKGDGLAQRIHYWRTHMEELPGGPVSETITLPDGESVVVSSPKLEKDAYAIAYGIVEYFLDSLKMMAGCIRIITAAVDLNRQ